MVDDLKDDLQIIITGWLDARRDDIEKVIQGRFNHVGFQQMIHDIVVPYVRSNHAKVTLDLGPDTTIVAGRQLQKQIIDALIVS